MSAMGDESRQHGLPRSWRVVGRLRSDVSVSEAQRDMDVIATRLERAYPSENMGLGVNVVALYDQMRPSYRLALWTLFGAVWYRRGARRAWIRSSH